jgi:predicted ArsR family transcriptional regulator
VARSLSRRIEAVATLRDPRRRRLYDYVIGQPGAVSRDQAAATLRVSRPAAAFHLDKLVSAGLLEVEYRRLSGRTGPGAGRPSKLYRRTGRRLAISLPPREHELLATFLAGSIDAGDGPIRRIAAAREFGESLGARARRRIRGALTPERRLECLERVLERVGFAPGRVGDVSVRMRECPFEPLSRRFPEIVCGAGISLVEGIVAGVEADDVRVGREPQRETCCVYLMPRSTSPSPDASVGRGA